MAVVAEVFTPGLAAMMGEKGLSARRQTKLVICRKKLADDPLVVDEQKPRLNMQNGKH